MIIRHHQDVTASVPAELARTEDDRLREFLTTAAGVRRLDGLEPGLACLDAFAERMKQSGVVAAGPQRSDQTDAALAPPATLPHPR